MKNKIAVIGTGTAGMMSLSHLCTFLENDTWEVYSIHDPNIPILGVGESTTPSVPRNLFYGIDFSFSDDYAELSSTIKHSVKYVNWRQHSFKSLIDTSAYGIHFDNTKLSEFVQQRLEKKYPTKFKKILGNVKYLKNISNGVEVCVNDAIFSFDYVIDCRGFPELYEDCTILNLPLNRALVTSIDSPGDWDYTYHYAHDNGWMFGIPLTTRQGWGYMYNDNYLSADDAKNKMASILKKSVDELSTREYRFTPFYANSVVDGRIVKNGNRFLFFEPLEALSTYYYDMVNKATIDLIRNNMTEQRMNTFFNQKAQELQVFISYVYHGGSIYTSDFWNDTKNNCSEFLKSSVLFSNIVNYYKSMKNRIYLAETISPFSSHAWFAMEKNLEYNYF